MKCRQKKSVVERPMMANIRCLLSRTSNKTLPCRTCVHRKRDRPTRAQRPASSISSGPRGTATIMKGPCRRNSHDNGDDRGGGRPQQQQRSGARPSDLQDRMGMGATAGSAAFIGWDGPRCGRKRKQGQKQTLRRLCRRHHAHDMKLS